MLKTSGLVIRAAVLIAVIAGISFALAQQAGQGNQAGPSKPENLPTGMMITPAAARGAIFQRLNPGLPDLPDFTVDHPITTAASPDGNTLLILTSGFNRNYDSAAKVIPAQSHEYVFVYNIRQHPPTMKQVLQVPNTFAGLAWNPDGKEFYVSGGSNDNIHVFEPADAQGEWNEAGQPIPLGHGASGLGLKLRTESEGSDDLAAHPAVAGVAVNAKGTLLLAVNYENDSVSMVDLKTRRKTAEVDLRPGKIDGTKKGVPGGEFPFWAVFKGDEKAYVSSLRDREIVVLDTAGTPKVLRRIKIHGQPNKMILNKAGTLLFATVDNSDSVNIINTSSDQVVASIKTTAPSAIFPNPGKFKGSNPNSLVLSPDEHTLYVTNGGTNSVAVISLNQDPDDSRVIGLVPTGWYPSSISLNRDGSMLYVVNGKGNPGPNPRGCRNSMEKKSTCGSANQYILQLTKGGFLSLPRPDATELKELTEQVARNNHFTPAAGVPAPPIFSMLHSKIKHVIYIVKENRTYDQLLGDLEKGNGDPSLALFKDALAPNHHQLARQFVTLDNFFDSGEVSGNGWNWSTAARATDITEKTVVMNYARRGFSYDFQGTNREINTATPGVKERIAMNPAVGKLPDVDDQLPGTADLTAPDGSEDESGAGYLWDGALRAGLAVRNYGFYCDGTLYEEPPDSPDAIPLLHDPASAKKRVAFPSNSRLLERTDPYFRSFDQRFPDYWRFKEWEREFDDYVKNNNLPNLELMWINHDHFGAFGSAIDGINTVDTQIGDNDYALGLIVEKVAHSKYSQDTLIFVIEDDAQNGPDHVDAHRSIALVAGPFVKQGAVISQRYTTVSVLRTIEEVLGIKPLGLNDAVQAPMTEVFNSGSAPWAYEARVPVALRATQLPLPAAAGGATASYTPRHDAHYWEEQTQGMDFSAQDRLESARFNLVLWKGMMGEDVPYPAERSGKDLRNKHSAVSTQQSARQQ